MLQHQDHFHGSDLEKIEKIYGIRKEEIISFSANVNPLGISPLLRRTLTEHIDAITAYPDREYTSLRQCIAGYCGCEAEHVIVGNGSTELISLFIQIEHPKKAMIIGPTYSEYEREISLGGGTTLYYPLREDNDFHLNVADFTAHLNENIDLLVLCNPNNPTGTYVPIGELEAFADTLPEDVLLVMDEAYMEFATEPDCCSMVDYIKAHPEKSILVLRTFSKYYAMAGLRVGYALGSEELIGILRKCSASWNLNVCAQKAAVAGLADQEYYQEQKAKIVEGREYLEKEMAALGCRVYPSQSNFIYFDTGKDPAWIQEQLMEKGIRIGAFEMSRVSVGTMEECKLYIKALKEILEAAE